VHAGVNAVRRPRHCGSRRTPRGGRFGLDELFSEVALPDLLQLMKVTPDVRPLQKKYSVTSF
jgi:hypothetical protein